MNPLDRNLLSLPWLSKGVLRTGFGLFFLSRKIIEIQIMRPAAYVYLLTNQHHSVLYVGMTTDLRTRLWEHLRKINPGSFSARYNLNKPVYFEGLDSEEAALERERFIKRKSRVFKETLITKLNPNWDDLTDRIMAMDP
jgi:putative endonuclease